MMAGEIIVKYFSSFQSSEKYEEIKKKKIINTTWIVQYISFETFFKVFDVPYYWNIQDMNLLFLIFREVIINALKSGKKIYSYI